MICFLAFLSTLGQTPTPPPAQVPSATAGQAPSPQKPVPKPIGPQGGPVGPAGRQPGQSPVMAPAAPPTLPAATEPLAPDKVALTVNGHPILAKQLQRYLWQWNANQVSQNLVIMELIKEEANREHIVVTEAAIKKDMQDQLANLLRMAPRGTTAEQALKARNISVSQLEFNSRAKLLMQKIAENSLKPSDFVRVAVLIVRPKSQQPADMPEALAKANEAYAALQKGETWEKVVSTYSSDTQSIPKNGEVGWTALMGFPASTKAELATLKVNTYTKPFQTPQGVEIFRLENRGESASAGELDPIKQRYLNSKEREIIENLRKTAVIKMNF